MILSSLPTELIDILASFQNKGFIFTLVGGATRDYFLTGEFNSTDLDFEVRYKDSLDEEQWSFKMDELRSYFKDRDYKVSEFPYLITKVDYRGYSLDFSSPRLEEFDSSLEGSFSHHNFKAYLASQMTYEESFKRRDFSINAIGVEFDFVNKTEQTIDPFNGISALKERKLIHIDHHFFNDPVRFLRLIRFKRQLYFKLDDSLKSKISSFVLTEVNHYYIIEEMFKTDVGYFLNQLKQWVAEFKIPKSEAVAFWTSFKKALPLDVIKAKESLLLYIYLFENSLFKSMASALKVSQKIPKEIESVAVSYQHLSKLTKDTITDLGTLDFSDKSLQNTLKHLKNVHEKKSWIPLLELFQQSPEHWISELTDRSLPKIDAKELESVPIDQRSLLFFYKLLGELNAK